MISEKCGVFSIYSNKNSAEKIFYRIFKLQYKNQKFCEIVIFHNKKIHLITYQGFVRYSFTKQEIERRSKN